MNYTKICEIFRSLALSSGEVIMDVYKSSAFEVLLKSDDSPVTIADKKQMRLFQRALKSIFRKYQLLLKNKSNLMI